MRSCLSCIWQGLMMTKEEIIDLARESGLFMFGLAVGDRNEKHFDMCLFDFAKLVAEKEREECVKVAENISNYDRDEPETSIAKAIRARGQK